MPQTSTKNTLRRYCIDVLVSKENAVRDSRLKLESEIKTLMKLKNELKFEFVKLGASKVCIESAHDDLIQQNELLAKSKRLHESDINILRKKRALQRAAFLWGSTEAIGDRLQKRNGKHSGKLHTIDNRRI